MAIIVSMSSQGPVLLPKFDRYDPETMQDPYRVYARLRQAGPLCRGGPGQWVVTWYLEVNKLLHDSRLGHQFIDTYQTFSCTEAVTTFFRNIIFERDGLRHNRLRDLLSKAFSADMVWTLSHRVVSHVDRLLDVALEQNGFDAVKDLAIPLPALAVGELLGIPLSDLEEVQARARRLGNAFDMRNPPNQDRTGANQAVTWLRDYIGRLLQDRRKKRSDDLISRMLATQEMTEGLTDEEIVDNAIFIFFSGLDTTKDLLATGCAALVRHPNELKRLRDDKGLLSSAVEEFLRYDAPIQALARLVREPIEINGRTIKTGRVLVLLIGSANHDERYFHEPSRLDVGRSPNRHLSFGGGSYYCLGAALTRVTACAFFRRVLERSSSFAASAEPIRLPNSVFRSYQSIPISIRP